MTSALPNAACPLDGTPLHCTGSAWTCASGHSFDIASQGYTNLLPVQHKRSRDPGDSKEMVAARRRFLAAGFYRPIAAAVGRAALADLPADATISCLDAGCGEGYYLRQLAAAAGDEHTLALLGLDISKWAVLAAAKQDKRPVGWQLTPNCRCCRHAGPCCACSASPFISRVCAGVEAGAAAAGRCRARSSARAAARSSTQAEAENAPT